MATKKKIRVLHIIGSGTIGGAENFAYQLASYQKDHDAKILPAILFCRADGYFCERAKQAQLCDFDYKRSGGLHRAWVTVQYFRNFDILQFHGLYPELFFLALLARRRILYSVHGARAITASPAQVLSRLAQTPSLKSLPTFRGLQRFLIRQWLSIFLKYIVAQVHAPSRHYVDFYIQRYKVPERKISRLPLGIDFYELRATRPPAQIRDEIGLKSERIIGCIATFRRLKRIDRLISGFARLLQMNLTLNVKLLIVGDGVERENLERQINDHELRSHVIMTGMRRDVADLLSIMDIFVMPSESENFPLSLIEAMHTGLPVVGFRGSGGVEEMLNESNSGLLVDNEAELAVALDTLLKDREQAQRLGNNGHCYANENLSLKACAERMKSTYERALIQ